MGKFNVSLSFAPDFKEKGHTKRSAFVYPKAIYDLFYINLNGVKFGVRHEKAGNEPTS